ILPGSPKNQANQMVCEIGAAAQKTERQNMAGTNPAVAPNLRTNHVQFVHECSESFIQKNPGATASRANEVCETGRLLPEYAAAFPILAMLWGLA
ncbi:hypothetical protein, partial [Aestuariivita boseongensis]|uniref:hypothetical protein n=1 Tax=Aestuariivita boseongensis TaxID=1470562 RepID=UPI001C11ADAE